MGKARVSAAGNTGVDVLEVTLNPDQPMSVKDLGAACLAAAQAMQPTAKADDKKRLAAAAEDLLDQLEQGNTKKSGTGEKRESQLLSKRSQTRSNISKRRGPGNGPPSRKAPTWMVTSAGDKKTKEDQSEEEADEEEADEEEDDDQEEDDDDQEDDDDDQEEDDEEEKEDSGEDDDQKDDKKSGDTTDDDPNA